MKNNQQNNQATSNKVVETETRNLIVKTTEIVQNKNMQKKEKTVKKQETRKKQKPQKIVPTDKIRNIQIKKKQYFATYLTVLAIACTLLLGMVIFLMTQIRVWWVWLIDLSLLGFCIWRCVHLCVRVNNQSIYTIYSNCIVIRSMMLDTVIENKNIYDVAPFRNWADKLNKKPAHSIAIYLAPKHKDKVVIGFLDEDLTALSNEILAVANKCKIEDKSNK